MIMSSTTIRIFGAGLLAAAVAMYAPQAFSGNNNLPKADTFTEAASRGAAWLVSVQGHDGGWGHDGGEPSYILPGERLESSGNDVANTGVSATALLHLGSTP